MAIVTAFLVCVLISLVFATLWDAGLFVYEKLFNRGGKRLLKRRLRDE